MNQAEFEFIAGFLKERSGLVLSNDKAYLLESRLMPIARKMGIASVDDLIGEMRRSNNEDLKTSITEAMTTNESFFFRDQKPFDLFNDNVLPGLLESRASAKSFRIWCAAASSGQEPYSLAILLKEAASKLNGWRHEIVATDISHEILKKAVSGEYSQFEVQRGMPITLLVKYFDKVEDHWVLKDDIRRMVQFKYFNLLDSMAGLGKFDVVFCRNVLIYFDPPTKAKVLAGIAGLMPDDGLLFLGGAETVLGISDKFQPVKGQRGLYQVVR